MNRREIQIIVSATYQYHGRIERCIGVWGDNDTGHDGFASVRHTSSEIYAVLLLSSYV